VLAVAAHLEWVDRPVHACRSHPVPGVGLLLGLLEMLLALPLLGVGVITMALLAALSVWLLSSRSNGPG
jgi:hypothetical protein